MKKGKDDLEYLFKRQSRGTEERIRREENSVHNSHNICSIDFEFDTEIKTEGLLHGTRL